MRKSNTLDFVTKGNKIHNNRYDYSLVEYQNNSTKVKIICSLHGEFEQTPNKHLSGQSCPSCRTNHQSNTLDFTSKANKIHNNKYDYSLVEYQNNSTKVKIICQTHGVFEQTPNSHLNGRGCSTCGKLTVAKSQELTHDEFIKKLIDTHGDKYDYSLVGYRGCREPITLICQIHGKFSKMPYAILAGQGCKQCGVISMKEKQRHTTEQFITNAIEVHGNKYDYSLVKYVNSKTKIKIICREHGIFEQRPNNHYNGQNCPHCTANGVSVAERQITELVMGYTTNTRTVIPPLELDIYIPSKNIAIEYNGLYWHTEQKGKDKKYHLNKTEQCEEKGIQLIHIFEDEWLHRPKIVRSRVRNLTGQIHRSIYARKCEIREIDTKTKGKFLDKYHIQGNDKSRVKLGLFYKNRLVAVMTFGKSRYSKKIEWELIRYCTISNFRIIGGAGKLLKHFEREHKPKSLVSYADRRWSQGKVYKALGFVHSHNSAPNYFYVKDHEYIRRSRVQFQKHKLKDKLEVFDETKTEYQNMLMNNIDRIWDCGNMVFLKEY